MNNTIQTVRVALAERGYDIDIGRALIAETADRVAHRLRLSHVLIVTDENVLSPHAQIVQHSFQETGVNTDLITFPPGEASKSIEQADRLWNESLQRGAHRQTVLVAVGGGVTGDLAGFVAATFGRGIRFVQIPTTLLAQVDSSVGGKVGINLPGAKNMVGAFWQPTYVLIDSDVLSTLSDRHYRAGLAEVVKYGVILDADLFAYLEAHVDRIRQRDADVLRTITARCCRLKAEVVEADERELSGRRAVLNYGHTFGHAIEAIAGYGQFLHGEAVSIGMQCAARLAADLNMIPPGLIDRQHRLLAQLELPTAMPSLDHDQMIEAMQHDKKLHHGKLRFILPTRLGHVELVEGVATEKVRAALND